MEGKRSHSSGSESRSATAITFDSRYTTESMIEIARAVMEHLLIAALETSVLDESHLVCLFCSLVFRFVISYKQQVKIS